MVNFTNVEFTSDFKSEMEIFWPACHHMILNYIKVNKSWENKK